jgi:N-acyl-D-aspartate/D-glutamate deacylase
VAIADGRIRSVGEVRERGAREIDAGGLVVAPGFIDVHTHYDAQYTWDPYATSSIWHGVTTTVIGNCGFAIAPCRPADRDLIMRTLVKVEGMSLAAMRTGITWGFETFPEYLDHLERCNPSLNVAALVGHSTIRQWVMGGDSQHRVATSEEIEAMARMVREAMAAGAIGLGSSTAEAHVGENGLPVASRMADKSEFLALTRAMGESGRGLFQATIGSKTSMEDLGEIWRTSGRPVIWAAFFQRDDRPGVRARAPGRHGGVSSGRRRGAAPGVVPAAHHGFHDAQSVSVRGHARVAARDGRARVRLARRLWQRRLPRRAQGRPRREALRRLPRSMGPRPGAARDAPGAQGARRGEPGRSRPAHREASGGRLARSGHRDGLDVEFLAGLLNTDEKVVGDLIVHPLTLITLSDAGAHLSLMCDAGYSSTLLGKWVRGLGRLSLEAAVKRLTDDPARAYRIPGRGRLAPGYWADVAIFDPATVDALPVEWVRDLPADEPRFVCRARGVEWSLVNWPAGARARPGRRAGGGRAAGPGLRTFDS